MIYSNSNIELLQVNDFIQFQMKSCVKIYKISSTIDNRTYYYPVDTHRIYYYLNPVDTAHFFNNINSYENIFWHLKIISNKQTFANKFNCFIPTGMNSIASHTLEDLTKATKALFLIYEHYLSISPSLKNI